MDAKERLIEAALRLFPSDGYTWTSPMLQEMQMRVNDVRAHPTPAPEAEPALTEARVISIVEDWHEGTQVGIGRAHERIDALVHRMADLESRPAPAVPDTVKELREAAREFRAEWPLEPHYYTAAVSRLLRALDADQAAQKGAS